MQMDVDTAAVAGLADAVRRAAAGLGAVDLPPPPPCEDGAAGDAIGALLSVCAEQLGALSTGLSTVAVLVDTARFDYTQAEDRAVPLP